MKQAVTRKGSVGAIRIIAGQWRGRKLPVLEKEGLRPTTDRTKETLFNWLAPYIDNRVCLDAFAGSGSLGFEALSRRAAKVTFVEQDRQVANQLQKNLATLGLSADQARVIQDNLLSFLHGAKETYGLVFLDPPFGKGLLQKSIDVLEQQGLLSEGALIYLECEVSLPLSVPANWQLLKQKQTKQVSYSLYLKETL
ncbi:16S rRNA (guanine(966)-N(2))-methyltransferase RsmD [Aliiglaciecola sp. CAU 1673]|uniref:16S rRNA (guanine(966)-N(2))-methyltransferase RsmD n=1 Tax=Aliiglaciecola sp. CAU 1673 TaxID=3032595 RepID=UPI0023DC307C|nr:16S rRNA (guanine(966)-N(2))-methyltransferase RsmD [Aliiglaciecola sp. CAU 1673]MDF2177817.1 16S rRNA (guanine(966)-N(2))-methyltransferase RsmD [Aliiglaciecola sp. CAU 1673]